MRRSIRVFTLAFTAALVLALVPAAQGRPVGTIGPACVEREDAAAHARGIDRDDVSLDGRDELSSWIRRHPAVAARATDRVVSGPITVQVAFHVIRKNLTREGGNVSAESIRKQIRVMNASYGGRTGGANTGFTFELDLVTRTTSAKWFTLTGSAKELEMKTALKVGGPETLNIYSANLGSGLLGYAYLAQDADEVGVLDGVVIHYRSMPGVPNAFTNYGRGDTATHEVGHWLDLLHTFEGGCKGEGDRVDDTAPEASPATGCPEGRDTCAGGGLDPITNFMDYSFDTCMFRFTAGQAERAQHGWAAFRAP